MKSQCVLAGLGLWFISLVTGCSSTFSITDQYQAFTKKTVFEAMPTDISPVLLPNSGLQSIRAVVGQIQVIQIVSNPSTGYQWVMEVEEPLKNCLEIIRTNRVYEDPDTFAGGVKRVGSPGKQEWQLKTRCEGTYRLVFKYSRPWEQGPAVFQTIAEIIARKE